MQLVEKTPPTVECLEHVDDSWVFMTSYKVWDGEDVSEVRLHIDSACFDRVCPPSLMGDHPILSCSMEINGSIKTADGAAMTYAGDRDVPFMVGNENGENLRILVKFRFLKKVLKAMVSVAKLAQSGFDVEFNGKGSYIFLAARDGLF